MCITVAPVTCLFCFLIANIRIHIHTHIIVHGVRLDCSSKTCILEFEKKKTYIRKHVATSAGKSLETLNIYIETVNTYKYACDEHIGYCSFTKGKIVHVFISAHANDEVH